jgi:hypothetical protein
MVLKKQERRDCSDFGGGGGGVDGLRSLVVGCTFVVGCWLYVRCWLLVVGSGGGKRKQ